MLGTHYILTSFSGGVPSISSGMLILVGLMVFVVAEKFFSVLKDVSELKSTPVEPEKINNNIKGYNSLLEKTEVTNGSKHVSMHLVRLNIEFYF